MPPKARIPAPIDRPISRAYLRQFKGWSCAYPPGLSDPATCRILRDMYVDRDTSLRRRPGLKYLTKLANGNALNRPIIGGFEPFYQNDGSLAYLFAARAPGGLVEFWVGAPNAANTSWTVNSAWSGPFPFTAPGTINFAADCTFVKYLQIDNKIIALPNNGDTPVLFYVGTSKTAKQPASITYPVWSSVYKPVFRHPDFATEYPTPTVPVAIETPTAGTAGDNTTGTLVSSTAKLNTYSMGAFFTFYNEFGESAPSQMRVTKVRRPWASWLWETANAAGEPTGTPTDDPADCADQLIAYIGSSQFSGAIAQGALGWNLYVCTWSDDGVQPSEAILAATRAFTASPVYADEGWLRVTQDSTQGTKTLPVPTLANRRNSTDIGKPTNGLVAADRLILVNDRNEPARIRWSSNLQGEYTNFSSAAGGGYKTLTSGNLHVPSDVELWQNPQSVDTLTILTIGTDGKSTGYYMQPAEVTSQSDATPIMGFEETTATPGTVSEHGSAVVNNALYHPLDSQLMKSTAANYNINHKSMSEMIRNAWQDLNNKKLIVSCQFDNKLFLLVQNDYAFGGGILGTDHRGNEIWILDIETQVWARWCVQANSIQTMRSEGNLVLAITTRTGVFFFDENALYDQYVEPAVGVAVRERNIGFQMETNTQGANRAHDAWAHLQQVNVTFGNLQGYVKWGIRSWDINGKPVEIYKITKRPVTGHAPVKELPHDVEDFLLVRRDLREWRFFAEYYTTPDDVESPYEFYGSINTVQYRYTPVSVNVGYEMGSVETFEYGRAQITNSDFLGLAPNGVPAPFVDGRTP